jgi:hypothetical protein
MTELYHITRSYFVTYTRREPQQRELIIWLKFTLKMTSHGNLLQMN